MARSGADFTLTFRRLAEAQTRTDGDSDVRSLFTHPASFDDWVGKWRERLTRPVGRLLEGPLGWRGPRPRVVDAVVPALLVLWTFIGPMSDDDGYYAAMAVLLAVVVVLMALGASVVVDWLTR